MLIIIIRENTVVVGVIEEVVNLIVAARIVRWKAPVPSLAAVECFS